MMMSIFTHPTTCAFNQEGPCTCGYQDFIDECRADENKEIIDQIMAEEEQDSFIQRALVDELLAHPENYSTTEEEYGA
jgi:hypothetical protein